MTGIVERLGIVKQLQAALLASQEQVNMDADEIGRLRALNGELFGLVQEIVDEGRADPAIGWWRRARAAIAKAEAKAEAKP